MTHRLWIYATGFFTTVGLLLTSYVEKAAAQWTDAYRTMAVGQFTLSLLNKGMAGRRDQSSQQELHGFGYPGGRTMLVYSGGPDRHWNSKGHSAGEGMWIMSRTGGNVHITFAGSNLESSDIVNVNHDVATYPEAYLGPAHHDAWALSSRNADGHPNTFVQGPPLANPHTNYWPAIGPMAGRNVPATHPAIIQNLRMNEYRSGVSFADRVAAGELPKLSPPAWVENMSEADFPDMIGIQRARSNQSGMEWTRRWKQWGTDGYSDFLLNENVVVNNGNATAEDVYLVIKNRFASQQGFSWFNGGSHPMAMPGNRLPADDYSRSTLAPNYRDGGAPLGNVKPAGLARGKALADQGHAMVYFHDGNQNDPAWPHNDWGDPKLDKFWIPRWRTEQAWIKDGYFNHATYYGLGVVDAFPPFNTYGGADPETYVVPHNNPATTDIDESQQQPASVTIWRFESHASFEQPDPSKDSNPAMYDMLTKEWGTPNGYQAEPEFNDHYSEFVTFGPYTLQPGEKFKVVVAYVAGDGSHHPRYNDYRRYAKPFGTFWRNQYNGPGQPISNWESRQQEIPYGEEAMFTHFERAIDVYNNGYKVPHRPPNIRLTPESNLLGQNQISWSAFGRDSKNPDTGASDLVGYRIYRSAQELEGPWELQREFTIADALAGRLPSGVTYDANGVFATQKTSAFPAGIALRTNRFVHGDPAQAAADPGQTIPGVFTYDDATSRAGFPYWYTVRYAKAAGQESQPGPNMSGIVGRNAGVVPVVPGAEIFDRFEERVRVVPNPYRQDSDSHSYLRSQNIRFTNLPGRCQIDIYDMSGQRVWTQFNDNLVRGEVTWTLFTENRPSNFGASVFPGVYYWKVTSLMPQSLNQTQTGTFLIIR